MVTLPTTVVLFMVLFNTGVTGRTHLRGPNICSRSAENPCCGGWAQFRPTGPCIRPLCDPLCEGGYCVAPDTCVCKDGTRGRDCSKKQARRSCAELGCEHVCREVRGEARCVCRPGYTLTRDGITCQDLDECKVMENACEHGCVNSLGSYYCRCPPRHILNADGRTCRQIEIRPADDPRPLTRGRQIDIRPADDERPLTRGRQIDIRPADHKRPLTRGRQWFRSMPQRQIPNRLGYRERHHGNSLQGDMLRNQPWGEAPDNTLPISTRKERMEQAPPSGHLNPANSNGVIAGPCRRQSGCSGHTPCASGPCHDDEMLPWQPDFMPPDNPDSDCDNKGPSGPVIDPQVPVARPMPGPCSDGVAGRGCGTGPCSDGGGGPGCGTAQVDEEDICPDGQIFVESKDGFRVCIPTEDYFKILEEGCSEGETQIGPCTSRQLQARETQLHTARGLHAQERCSQPCRNGGHCLKGACVCPAGLQGAQCEEDIDECTDKKPCSHTCQNSFGSFQCACPEGLTLHTDGATCIRLFLWRYR